MNPKPTDQDTITANAITANSAKANSTAPNTRHSKNHGGFTLIELLMVLAILATLLSIALPRHLHSLDRAKETTLQHNLRALREAIEHYQNDHNDHPPDLQSLVQGQYLRSIPIDPFTEQNTTWVLHTQNNAEGQERVVDVRSGATAIARNGQAVASW